MSIISIMISTIMMIIISINIITMSARAAPRSRNVRKRRASYAHSWTYYSML